MTIPGPAATPPPRRRRIGRAIALAATLLVVAGLAGFGAFVASLDRLERDPPSRADGIVALTGGSQRIGDALELLAKGYGGRLLITGVNERTTRAEIERLSSGQQALVRCCVDLDYRARNTIENARETGRWVRAHGFGSLIVVTSNYHMPRTLIELEHVLPEIRKVPYVVVPGQGSWWANPGIVRLLAAEYAKFVAVWVRRRLGTAA